MDTTEICQKLVFMCREYAGYKVGNRGPNDLICGILKELWPELAAAIEAEGIDDAYTTFFDENGRPHFNPPESELEELAMSLASQVLKLQNLPPQMFADAMDIHQMLTRNPLYVLRHRQIEPPIFIVRAAGSWGQWTQDIDQALKMTESQWLELCHDVVHYELVRIDSKAHRGYSSCFISGAAFGDRGAMTPPFDLDGWRFTKPDWWRATSIKEPSLWIEILDGTLGVVDTDVINDGGDYSIPLTVIDKLRKLDDGKNVVPMDPRVMSLELLIESCAMDGSRELLKTYQEQLEAYLLSPEREAWEAANAPSK